MELADFLLGLPAPGHRPVDIGSLLHFDLDILSFDADDLLCLDDLASMDDALEVFNGLSLSVLIIVDA